MEALSKGVYGDRTQEEGQRRLQEEEHIHVEVVAYQEVGHQEGAHQHAQSQEPDNHCLKGQVLIEVRWCAGFEDSSFVKDPNVTSKGAREEGHFDKGRVDEGRVFIEDYAALGKHVVKPELGRLDLIEISAGNKEVEKREDYKREPNHYCNVKVVTQIVLKWRVRFQEGSYVDL